MDRNFVIILLSLLCWLTLLSTRVKGSEEYFKVIEDPVLVYQLAVEYAEMVSGITERPAKAITKTILMLKNDEIRRLCADAIPIDTYGFELLDLHENSIIEKKQFRVRHTEPPINYSLHLPVLACPPLSYLNIETNERNTFLYGKYYLSRAVDQNSAIVFKSEYNNVNTLNPQRYLKEISFEKLEKLAKNVETQITPDPIVKIVGGQSIEKEIITYQTSTRSVFVYTKFAQLYASLGVCSMRYSHKIHACRQVIGASSSRIKLVVEEHLTKPCMRRTVDLGDGPGEDTTKTSELYLSQCPPTIIEGLSKELRQTTIFYIASNASPRSVELFSRHNVPGEKIKPVNVAYNLDVRSMEQEKQRAKLFPNILILAGKTRKSASAESAYQNKKKLINMLNQSPVRTPAALQRQLNQISERRRQKKLTETMRLTHGISMVERALIEFSQVKINIFVYEKFAQTYASIDFCSLTSIQKKSLCDTASSHDTEHNLEPDPVNTSSPRPCYQQKVGLTWFEAEALQTALFSLWECPSSLNHPELTYYMGKSNFNNAAFLYRGSYHSLNSDRMNAIHPVTLVHNINRYILAAMLP